MRVHQVTGAAGSYDAVTEQMVAYSSLLEEWGLAGGTHATIVAPGSPRGIASLDRLRPAADDLLLIHYAGYVPGMRPLLDLPQRKLLVYHNVTPARYFWRVEPRVALTCQLGRRHLPRWIAAARSTAAVSSFNAHELRELGAENPSVVPILLDPSRLAPPGTNGAGGEHGPLVLSVGRLAPHKRPDLVIRAFALYQRHREPGARLLCVGPPVNPAYRAELERLVAEVGAREVTLAGGLPQADLNAALSGARVFLSLSEHEGFGVPLLEALHARLPAVARPSGGMPEVGGDAVLWVSEDDDMSVVAEAIHLAASDEDLRGELQRRAAAQVERFAPGRVAERLRAVVEAAAA
jgi:glycosyltransferase involved in cell wall biosynthesis